jgi:hypothetical protein
MGCKTLQTKSMLVRHISLLRLILGALIMIVVAPFNHESAVSSTCLRKNVLRISCGCDFMASLQQTISVATPNVLIS